jgi:predicted DNA repair protein MutK
MMKTLSVVGTAAMFLVGGGILTHGFPAILHWVEGFTSGQNSLLTSIMSLSTDAVVGILAGAAVLAVVTLVNRIRK